MQGDRGWNLKHALDDIKKREAGTPSARAAAAVAARLEQVPALSRGRLCIKASAGPCLADIGDLRL